MLRTSSRARLTSSVFLMMALGMNLAPTIARAITVDINPTTCGPSDTWLCYYFSAHEDSTSFAPLDTTFDEPVFEITINPILPADPENWRTINVYAETMGNAYYYLYYPSSEYWGWAQGVAVSFIDFAGTTFFTGGRPFQDGCREELFRFVCSEGNSIMAGKEFGEVNLSPFWGEPDPSFIPDILGPSRVRVAWTVYGDQPTSSTLRVNGVGFGFAIAPVPEPSTALLVGLGLTWIGMARSRKRV